MPAVQNCPGVSDFTKRCANLFTTGRCAPGTVMAIVLHEYDGPLQQIDAHHEQVTEESARQCHTSFHFAVGANGAVHQYVDIADTAWTFPQDFATNTTCGVGSWLVAAGQPGVDPNCYTINIAISTGQTTSDPFNQKAGPREQDNYSEQQVQAVIDLICCLIAKNGVTLTVNSNTVWRHLTELDNFPGCKLATAANPTVTATYQTILDCITECTNNQTTGIPAKAQSMCDVIECLNVPTGTGTPGPALLDWVDGGLKTDQNLIGTNPKTLATLAVTGRPFQKAFNGGYHSVSLEIDAATQTNVVTLTFDKPQTNLILDLAQFDPNDQLTGFSTVPTSATGGLTLAGGNITAAAANAQGTVTFAGPITTLSFTYSGTAAPTGLQNILLRNLRSDTITEQIPPEAIAGVTQLVGADCRKYTIPAAMAGAGDVTCTVLAAAAAGAPITGTTQLIGNDCQTHVLDLCALILATVPAATADAVPNSTMLLGRNCQSFFLPDFCELAAATTLVARTYSANALLYGQDSSGACGTFNLDICAILNAEVPATLPQDAGTLFLGRNDDGICGMFAAPVSATDICTLLNGAVPATLPVDAGTLVLGRNGAGVCGMFALPATTTFCALFNASTPPTGAALANGALVLGSDCQMHAVDVCTLLAAKTPATAPNLALPLQLLQTGTGAECLVQINAPDCDQFNIANIGLGASDGGSTELGIRRTFGSINTTPAPNSPFDISGAFNVYTVDASAGTVQVSLTSPDINNCDHHTHIWFKRIDTVAANVVNISPTGNNIEGAAVAVTLNTPGPFNPNGGEALELVWDNNAATWRIV